MRKYFLFLSLLTTGYLLLTTGIAHADDFATIYQKLAQADPVSYIVSGFNYVAGFIAALVVLMILYGVIKKMASPGSSSAQGESKALFWNLAGGFLLFALAYFFFTNILSPDLGTLKLPTLTALQNNTSTTAISCNPQCTAGFTCNTTASPPACAPTGTTGVCGGTISANCPDPSQICVNQGTAGSPNYHCVATSSFDCGIPPSHPGTCASPDRYSCVRTDNPNSTPVVPTYGCRSN